MNWIDTNTLIAICTCAIGLTQFLLWKHIAKVKAYEAEKGKNLATKEDIAGITKEIESVKESYNKSLESHKIELQKEFEAHKYISNLCNSLDNLLLELISECLKAEASKGIFYPDNDNNLIPTTCKLARFLNTYRKRYESNESIKKLTNISNKINIENELLELQCGTDCNGDMLCKIKREDKDELLESLGSTLSLFLPPFKENKPEFNAPAFN